RRLAVTASKPHCCHHLINLFWGPNSFLHSNSLRVKVPPRYYSISFPSNPSKPHTLPTAPSLVLQSPSNRPSHPPFPTHPLPNTHQSFSCKNILATIRSTPINLRPPLFTHKTKTPHPQKE